MAHLDSVEARAAGNLDALYWWRRNEPRQARPPEALTQRIVALAERAAPTRTVVKSPQILEASGNRLRAAAEARRKVERAVSRRRERDAALLAAIRHERRRAKLAMALSLIETTTLTAATFYTAATHEPVAFGLALAGNCAASCGLYRALCRLLPIGAGGDKVLR